jgi:hypothetical protein
MNAPTGAGCTCSPLKTNGPELEAACEARSILAQAEPPCYLRSDKGAEPGTKEISICAGVMPTISAP